jgi:hypothetical protein
MAYQFVYRWPLLPQHKLQEKSLFFHQFVLRTNCRPHVASKNVKQPIRILRVYFHSVRVTQYVIKITKNSFDIFSICVTITIVKFSCCFFHKCHILSQIIFKWSKRGIDMVYFCETEKLWKYVDKYSTNLPKLLQLHWRHALRKRWKTHNPEKRYNSKLFVGWRQWSGSSFGKLVLYLSTHF